MKKPRYKHKLNMLEPGIKLCKGIGILILISLMAWWWNLTCLFTITCVGIGIVVLIFLILLIIEQHQDKMMYLDAKREDSEVK